MPATGCKRVGRGRGEWRVLIRSRGNGSRIAVGQLTAYRGEIARGSALRTVMPFAVLVPCLMLLVSAVIGYSLRPVARLARALDASDYDNLAALPLPGVPEELRPFIRSINRLLGRIGVMIEQQRRFVADAAHELRSPVTALTVQAENLGHAELPPESRARLAALQSGIRRTGHLLRDCGSRLPAPPDRCEHRRFRDAQTRDRSHGYGPKAADRRLPHRLRDQRQWPATAAHSPPRI